MSPVKNHPRLIVAWLCLCAALVVAMVLVGGYTRLSGSGLSITEWKPIHGVIPPLNDAAWQEEFDKYRQIPQYRGINQGMTLAEFKTIFWPEFFHRLLGRTIGMVFLLPLIFFWSTGAITHRFGIRLIFIFALGGVQGFMGWYMVKSGLIDNVYVSHFRLAAHLALALLLLGLLIWAICDSLWPRMKSPSRHDYFILWFTLLCLQIMYGAFMAGLHCGLLYNSYSTMDGAWIPNGLWEPNLAWLNFFENCTAVQFIHRILAILVVFGFGFWWFINRHYVRDKKLINLMVGIALVLALQFSLGVLTLINAVPLGLGLLHQMTAVLLFSLSVIMMHRIR